MIWSFGPLLRIKKSEAAMIFTTRTPAKADIIIIVVMLVFDSSMNELSITINCDENEKLSLLVISRDMVIVPLSPKKTERELFAVDMNSFVPVKISDDANPILARIGLELLKEAVSSNHKETENLPLSENKLLWVKNRLTENAPLLDKTDELEKDPLQDNTLDLLKSALAMKTPVWANKALSD